MDTEAPKDPPRHGSNLASIFITSLSAAIVVAGGSGIIFEALAPWSCGWGAPPTSP